jgi:hypothetical protein
MGKVTFEGEEPYELEALTGATAIAIDGNVALTLTVWDKDRKEHMRIIAGMSLKVSAALSGDLQTAIPHAAQDRKI